MKTTPLKTRCPVCGHRLEAATAGGDTMPGPGDISICFACHGLALFTDTLGLRLPTEAEARAILGDPEQLEALCQAHANIDTLVQQARKEKADGN